MFLLLWTINNHKLHVVDKQNLLSKQEKQEILIILYLSIRPNIINFSQLNSGPLHFRALGSLSEEAKEKRVLCFKHLNSGDLREQRMLQQLDMFAKSIFSVSTSIMTKAIYCNGVSAGQRC